MGKKKSKISKGRTIAWLFLLPALILFALFQWYPMLKAIWVSFFNYSYVGKSVFIGLKNYIRAFKDPIFWIAWKNTFYAGFLSIVIGFVPPIFVAIILNEVRKFKSFFKVSFYIPVITSMVIISIMWKWIYNPDYGLLNWFLSLFGFEKLGWLTDPKLSMPSIVLMASWKALGRGVIIYLAALQNVPEQLYEAAEIDGAGFWHKVWHITIPSIMPIMSIMLILKIIGSLQIFASVYIMTEGGPMYATEVVAHYIYNTAFRDMDMGYATAMAMIMFIVLMFVTYIQLKLKKSA